MEDYYDERGWDKKLKIPKKEKLEELGLGAFQSALALRLERD